MTIVCGQSIIGYNPAHYESGVTYTSNTIEDIEWDFGEEGYNVWNLTSLGTGNEQAFEVVPYSAGLPDIDHCIMVPNYIVYYHTVTDTSEIEGWGYFHVNSARQLGLGLTGTMETSSSYFLNAFNTVTDPSIEFPTSYGDTWIEATQGEGQMGMGAISISYEVWDTVWNEVDAWGEITTPLGTFDCLRIKKRSFKHSHSDHIFFGFDKVERQVKYVFITYEIGLTATFSGPKDTLDGMPDSTFTVGKLDYQIENTMLNLSEGHMPDELSFSVYPNPFNSSVNIDVPSDARVTIYDLKGHKIDDFYGSRLWKPELPSGVYLLNVLRGNTFETKRISYIK